MTYLDLVNKVLIRLREDEVTSVSDSAYSKLIGEFVNDALRIVEDAWAWSALRTTLTVTTINNTSSYSLTNSGNNVTILDAINDTSNNFLQYQTATWFNNIFLNTTPSTGSPYYYSFDSVDSNGDTKVRLYPIPNAAYSIKFHAVKRTKELSADTDTVVIPTAPIIHMAVALATRERGEMGGNMTSELFVSAERMLSDAIAMDAAKHPEELVFMAV